MRRRLVPEADPERLIRNRGFAGRTGELVRSVCEPQRFLRVWDLRLLVVDMLRKMTAS